LYSVILSLKTRLIRQTPELQLDDDNLMAWANRTQLSTQMGDPTWEKARTSTGRPLRLPFGGAGVATRQRDRRKNRSGLLAATLPMGSVKWGATYPRVISVVA